MGVQIQCDADTRMAEPARYGLDVEAARYEHGRMGVPQVVEPQAVEPTEDILKMKMPKQEFKFSFL